MKTRALIAAIVGCAVFSPRLAQAQSPWLQDRRVGEGIGIRTGDLELHPAIAGQVGYNSNFFQRSEEDSPPNNQIISTAMLQVIPSLTLKTLGAQRRADSPGSPPKVDFKAIVAATYQEPISLKSGTGSEVSEQRDVALLAGLSANFFPRSKVGADVSVDFTRQVQPSNSIDSNTAFDRDSLRAGAGVTWRPGGGLFSWRLGYELRLNFFEDEGFQELNNIQHYIRTRGRWKFLPQTALLYDGSVGFINYSTDAQNGGGPIQARVGINGLISRRWSLLGMVGWGASFNTADSTGVASSYDSLIAQAEAKFFIMPKGEPGQDAPVGLSSIAAGYLRDFGNSYLGDFFQRDRGYLKFDYFGGGQFVVTLQGGLSHVNHPDIFFALPQTGLRQGAFSENRIDVGLFAEYRTSDTIGIFANLGYDQNISKKVPLVPANTVPAGQTVPVDDLSFQKFTAFLGARWFM